jgi:hypothetical protein
MNHSQLSIALLRTALVLALGFAPKVAAELVVSIRYFKEVGTSHYHLFLYRDDGTLVRQLTTDETVQDTGPVFSPDRKQIAFTRMRGIVPEEWVVGIDGKGARKLEAALDWKHPHFEDAYRLEGGGDNEKLWQLDGENRSLRIPGRKSRIVVLANDNLMLTQKYDATSFRFLTYEEIDHTHRISLTGGDDAGYCDLAVRKGTPFLFQPKLHGLFYWQHLGSTLGFRLGFLDLDSKRPTFLSENPAQAIPHGNRDGFFCVCEHRYQNLGKTGPTVNCTYLEWRNATLERIRFAKAISLFGGATIRVKDQPQLEIPDPKAVP